MRQIKRKIMKRKVQEELKALGSSMQEAKKLIGEQILDNGRYMKVTLKNLYLEIVGLDNTYKKLWWGKRRKKI